MTTVPSPFAPVRTPHAEAWVREEARPWVEASLEAGLTLHRAAAGAAGGGEVLSGGRGPVYVVRCAAGDWVVRHGLRGGMMARLLGDRYLRLGTPRPFREARASEAARRRGVATPRVMAAAVYPDGLFRRGDLVTELVPGARSLGSLLFGDARWEDGERRRALLRAAREHPGRLAQAGLLHRDLNVHNLIVPGVGSDVPRSGVGGGGPGEEVGAGEPGVGPREDPAAAENGFVLLDLDRCRVRDGPLPDGGARMAARLERSLRKVETEVGPPLTRAEWEAFLGAPDP